MKESSQHHRRYFKPETLWLVQIGRNLSPCYQKNKI